MKILSAPQIREWDNYTIKHEPISSINLMERAAGECTNWILQRNLSTAPIIIFCGKGNNGGDGLAIARQLFDKGKIVEVFIIELGAQGTEDFEQNLSRLRQLAIPLHFLHEEDNFPKINKTDIVVDCLFGTGLSRPLSGQPAALINYINDVSPTVVSIDLPSGMFADRSTIPNPVVKATYTLTFQVLKLCFLLPENEEHFGDVQVLDIGLQSQYVTVVDAAYKLVDVELIKQLYKPPKKFSHKGTFGHTLIIAGEKGKMGAALLCIKACLRSGSGLVTGLIPNNEFAIIQTAAPEAMAVPQENWKTIEWLRYSSIGIGPGLGTGTQALTLVKEAIFNFNKPLVIDADCLNILSANEELITKIPKGSILTPHPKEFERLFGNTTNNFERLELAKQRAGELGVYIIVKGAYSILACPDGEVYFNSSGNPGMATGGSGDVLTGILAGLLSRGYSSKHAAILGMYIHGLSGDVAAASLSQEALIAGDLIEFLGSAWLHINS